MSNDTAEDMANDTHKQAELLDGLARSLSRLPMTLRTTTDENTVILGQVNERLARIADALEHLAVTHELLIQAVGVAIKEDSEGVPVAGPVVPRTMDDPPIAPQSSNP